MTGHVLIVTGANSGLGYEAARYLCEGGNDVILACRDEEKANHAIEKIKLKNPNALATYMHLDMSDMESIRKFVEDFHATEKKLHGLINNAGVYLNQKDPKRQYSKHNFEITMGTNYLGHFLLTNLLLEDLKKTGTDGGDARIVNVTSLLHDPESTKRRGRQIRDIQPLDFDNFFLSNEGSYSAQQAYKNSKLCQIMFTYELARRLEGTGVTTNVVCPGFIPSTELNRHNSGASKFFTRYILHGMLRFTKITRTLTQGMTQIANIATDEKYKEVSGKYFRDGVENKSSEESLDEEKQKKLWEVSGGYTHLEGYEPIDVPAPPPEKVDEPKTEEAKAKEDGEKKEGEGEEEKTEEKTEEEKDNKTDEEKKTEKDGEKEVDSCEVVKAVEEEKSEKPEKTESEEKKEEKTEEQKEGGEEKKE